MSHFASPQAALNARNLYLKIFGALMVLTVVTVGVAQVHLPTPYAVAVAMLVATVKGTLVACYFMHLLDEKKTLYSILLLCALFFVVLMLLPAFTDGEGVGHNVAPKPAASAAPAPH